MRKWFRNWYKSKTQAINANVHDFVVKYKAARMEFIDKIIARDESQAVFKQGWTQRVRNA